MKRALVSAGLVLSSLLVGFGLAEALVRIFYPHSRDAVIPGHLFIIDNDVGWKLAPSRASTHHTRYFDARYTTNSFGFRDRNRQITKSRDTTRVLLYGDSLVFGWGLQDGERFSDIIERESAGLEIWNHGIPGWGLDQEIILYQNEGESPAADGVIFFVGASTLSQIHTGYVYAKYKPMFTRQQDGSLTLAPVPQRKNTFVSLLYEVFSPFYLPYFVQRQIASFQETRRLRASADGGHGLPSIESLRLIDGFSKDLLRMASRTARVRNQRMTILIANLSQADRRDLRSLCSEIGIECLEVAPEISATSTTDDSSELIFGRYDKHWNAKANKLIAAELMRQMKNGRPVAVSDVVARRPRA